MWNAHLIRVPTHDRYIPARIKTPLLQMGFFLLISYRIKSKARLSFQETSLPYLEQKYGQTNRCLVKLKQKITSMTLLWLSFTLFPWSIGRPSTKIGLLPSEDIKKSPLLRRRIVACFLETFAAGPSKLKSTSMVWSRVLRPTAIWKEQIVLVK